MQILEEWVIHQVLVMPFRGTSAEWVNKWANRKLMEFNKEKCQQMNISSPAPGEE